MREMQVCEGVPALVAVLGGGGAVAFATSGFTDRFDLSDGAFGCCVEQVEMIVAGQAARLAATVEGLDATLAAVVDRQDRRLALLMIPTDREEDGGEPSSPLFDEPLDESPAIVWLKDLDGRYLRVNSRYLEQLEIDAESVCGHTDAELTAASSIEGMRLEDKTIAASEPLELEYLIGAFEERPAFAALRFALRDADGEPTATCSVAAPLADAPLARSECGRLMRLDRWRRLDASQIRQELLEEWGLTPTDGSSGPPLDRDERVSAALVERDEALGAVARLEQELTEARVALESVRAESEDVARLEQELTQARAALDTAQAKSEDTAKLEQELTDLRAALDTAQANSEDTARLEQELTQARAALDTASANSEHTGKLEQEIADARTALDTALAKSEDAARHADELGGAVAAEQARSEELQKSLGRQEDRVSALECELTGLQDELAGRPVPSESPDAEDPPPQVGPRWDASGQRAFSAGFVGMKEWRAALRHATDTLGSEGGWDAAIAWSTERPGPLMRCGVVWMRDPAELRSFEARVWKHVEDPSTAEFGRARSRMATTCLLDLQSAEDPLLRAAADAGIGSAMLIPINDGGDTIAMLELLSKSSATPSPELVVALDAIALQLGGLAHLFKFADDRDWRLGRI